MVIDCCAILFGVQNICLGLEFLWENACVNTEECFKTVFAGEMATQHAYGGQRTVCRKPCGPKNCQTWQLSLSAEPLSCSQCLFWSSFMVLLSFPHLLLMIRLGLVEGKVRLAVRCLVVFLVSWRAPNASFTLSQFFQTLFYIIYIYLQFSFKCKIE